MPLALAQAQLPSAHIAAPAFSVIGRTFTRLLLCASAVLLLAGQAAAVASPVTDLSARSDQDLTQLAAQWNTLLPAERRVLLKEMQRRMARQRNGRSTAGSGLQIRTERRYGRRVKQADGSVVTIETRVVQLHTPAATARRERVATDPKAQAAGSDALSPDPKMQRPTQPKATAEVNVRAPKPANAPAAKRSPYGFGFERRSAQRHITIVPRRQVAPADGRPDPDSR